MTTLLTQEEDYIDEYVIGLQNPSQIVGSLALLLREKNYVGLYDTSILSSPEQYIKKNSFDALSRDFLYKWFLFFTGIERNVKSFDNLIILPEAAEEMINLINGVLSAIEKRKTQYKSLTPQQKDVAQSVFEQLLKNEEILQKLLNKVEEFRQFSPPTKSSIFSLILELIKFLNENLELKKTSSRKVNDTDERIVARTLYEILVNNLNVAVYTRDDDVRKLISTAFRLLVSKQIEDRGFTFLKNLSHLNLLVLKYNYEKKSFSRFFESSTLPHTGEFRFPRKISANRISQIIPGVIEILNKLRIEFEELNNPTEEDKEVLQVDNKIAEILEKTFQTICTLKIEEDAENTNKKIKILENLSTIANSLQFEDVAEKIREKTETLQKGCIQSVLEGLKAKRETLEKVFKSLSQEDKADMEYWQKIKTAAEEMQGNLLEIRFFESALRENFYQVCCEDYEHYKGLLEKFSSAGFCIDTKGTPISTEKISEVASKPISEVIRIVEQSKIHYEGTNAYLTQDNIIFFMELSH